MTLERVVGVPGAVLLGLGSILGTGVFVSLGLAAGVAGPWVVPAVLAAAGVATLNGLSSAQLAARYPVSGGTYEYGYRLLGPAPGFLAGWMFLCAKSASAATASLGFSGYALGLAGVGQPGARVALGLVLVGAVTGLVAGGMRRTNRINAVIVATSIASLVAFALAGVPAALAAGPGHLAPLWRGGGEWGASEVAHAAALLFVAYTGYGRIATLGEEVRNPARSIPRAIVITLAASAALYAAVATVSVGAVGSEALARATSATAAPLSELARGFGWPGLPALVSFGAMTAMAGVLLNLVLGLSRVWLAMARRGDAPRALSHVEAGSPRRAVWLTGAVVGALVLTGSVALTWSFSAFTVLVYYALTNLAALRLPPEARLIPRAVPAAGFAACLGLAFFVEPGAWLTGIGIAAAGLVWHGSRARARRAP